MHNRARSLLLGLEPRREGPFTTPPSLFFPLRDELFLLQGRHSLAVTHIPVAVLTVNRRHQSRLQSMLQRMWECVHMLKELKASQQVRTRAENKKILFLECCILVTLKTSPDKCGEEILQTTLIHKKNIKKRTPSWTFYVIKCSPKITIVIMYMVTVVNTPTQHYSELVCLSLSQGQPEVLKPLKA